MTCFGCAKVIAPAYPVTFGIEFPEIPGSCTVQVPSSEPVRLAPFMSKACQIRLSGTADVSAVLIANTFEELP